MIEVARALDVTTAEEFRRGAAAAAGRLRSAPGGSARRPGAAPRRLELPRRAREAPMLLPARPGARRRARRRARGRALPAIRGAGPTSATRCGRGACRRPGAAVLEGVRRPPVGHHARGAGGAPRRRSGPGRRPGGARRRRAGRRSARRSSGRRAPGRTSRRSGLARGRRRRSVRGPNAVKAPGAARGAVHRRAAGACSAVRDPRRTSLPHHLVGRDARRCSTWVSAPRARGTSTSRSATTLATSRVVHGARCRRRPSAASRSPPPTRSWRRSDPGGTDDILADRSLDLPDDCSRSWSGCRSASHAGQRERDKLTKRVVEAMRHPAASCLLFTRTGDNRPPAAERLDLDAVLETALGDWDRGRRTAQRAGSTLATVSGGRSRRVSRSSPRLRTRSPV